MTILHVDEAKPITKLSNRKQPDANAASCIDVAQSTWYLAQRYAKLPAIGADVGAAVV